jgi:hypothetical protein
MTEPENSHEKKTLGKSNPEEIKGKVEEVIKEALQQKHAPAQLKHEAQLLENFEIQLESHLVNAADQDSPAKESFWRQWVDILYGMLIAPRQTITILCDSTLFPPSQANETGAVLILGLALALGAACQLPQAGVGGCLGCFMAGLFSWLYLSITLYYVCHGKGAEKISFTSAAIALAWTYVPFLFTGILACYKGLMGQYSHLTGLLILLWFVLLVFYVFKNALNVSHRRLTIIAFTVPPVLVLSLSFWLAALIFFLLLVCKN